MNTIGIKHVVKLIMPHDKKLISLVINNWFHIALFALNTKYLFKYCVVLY